MEFIGFIDTVLDAFIISEAARRGEIKMMSKRPNVTRRNSIYDGMTIIFDETMTGMKRWTDGKVWAPSKLYNGFFLYEEKISSSRSSKVGNNTYIQSEDNNQNTDRCLLKKVITVITPDLHTLHVINYFYHDSPKGPYIKNNLPRPTNLNLPSLVSIIETAKKYQYYKCFRTKSRAWRKLYYAPEVESSDQGKLSHSSEPTPKTNPFGAVFIEDGDCFSKSHSKALSLPSVSNIFQYSDYTLPTSPVSRYMLPRHSESRRQLSILDRFSFL
ncbi:hypothetical protein K502DRAFT_213454 [Neoconidiobolus thromboides FSU 785]|nr:hypothetical protein K502DRAFT_213454 [Neoconidiobolus thromboides FSU 785]